MSIPVLKPSFLNFSFRNSSRRSCRFPGSTYCVPKRSALHSAGRHCHPLAPKTLSIPKAADADAGRSYKTLDALLGITSSGAFPSPHQAGKAPPAQYCHHSGRRSAQGPLSLRVTGSIKKQNQLSTVSAGCARRSSTMRTKVLDHL